MSRIGKKKIQIPSGVKVELGGGLVKVAGPKGNLELELSPAIELKIETDSIELVNTDECNRDYRALHGTMRALINNMVTGVSQGFVRTMQIYGTGYSIKEQGGKLVLSIGYCHPVEMLIPKGVKLEIKTAATKGNDVPAEFSLVSIDKQLLGQFAAEVRAVRPPEPYLGKGIRYNDEIVRRKVGKAFGS